MFLVDLFHTVLYQPILNLLVLLYGFVGDFGIAIILLTVGVRLLLSPLSRKATASQKAMAEIQPKVKEVQEKYKDNREEQGRAMMELYKQEGVNPMSGCLPILIQLPLLIALYRVFWRGFTEEQFSFLYSFVPPPETLDSTLLGLIDLNESHLLIALGAGALQFLQSRLLTPTGNAEHNAASGKKEENGKPDFQQVMQKQMLYFFPVFTVIILTQLPSAIGVYWAISSAFSVGEYYTLGSDSGSGEEDEEKESKHEQ